MNASLKNLSLRLSLLFSLAVAPVALAQEAPDALVKRVSQEVLQIIKTDPKVQAGDQARIREVIETKLLPHFTQLFVRSMRKRRDARSRPRSGTRYTTRGLLRSRSAFITDPSRSGHRSPATEICTPTRSQRKRFASVQSSMVVKAGSGRHAVRR